MVDYQHLKRGPFALPREFRTAFRVQALREISSVPSQKFKTKGKMPSTPGSL
jgi:hypothetical protein